jgi:hypothetical protein
MIFYPNENLSFDYDNGDYSEEEFYYMKEKLPSKLLKQIKDIANNRDMFRFKEVFKRIRIYNDLWDKHRAFEFSRYLVDTYEDKRKDDTFWAYPLK